MSLKDILIKESYESGYDDLVNDFYLPVLKNAISYDRIAGFFTSSSFAVSAKGVYELIKNGGKIRLLVSPKLNEKDIQAINSAYLDLDEIITESISKEILLEKDKIIKKYHEILCWMIKNDFLNIKIVLIKQNGKYLSAEEIESRGIFHQKIGIIKDSDNNIVTFSGSINETLVAWTQNIEEFKVFKSWDKTQNIYCMSDIKKFDDYWHEKRGNLYVSELPKLLKEKLIEVAPDDIDEVLAYIRNKNHRKKKSISLFYYQKEALEKWLSNDKSMLFEMATGTGKTRTAIACIEASLTQEESKVVIISTPQATLSMQWKNNVENLHIHFDDYVIADGNTNWRKKLKEVLLKIRIHLTKNVIIYTTHVTSSDLDFINIMNESIKDGISVLFVGDEVHALGSKKRFRALLTGYNERIGLSATPSRWFDEEGSKKLENYFNNVKYEFTISDALTTINPLTNKSFLSKYYYYPCFTTLTSNEMEQYIELTNQINKNLYQIDDDSENTFLNKLLRNRADIIKHAENKMQLLKNTLIKMGINEIENTIIFVSYAQIEETVKILNEFGIRNQVYTQERGTKPEKKYGGKSEREYIIDVFKKGLVKVLVAIKCLDEGIDIPTADTAILVSSTTNPREYIQRVGRVIRQAPKKKHACIYDMIINPSIDSEHDKKIMDREFNRIEHIAYNAENNAEVLEEIYSEFNGGNYGNKH